MRHRSPAVAGPATARPTGPVRWRVTLLDLAGACLVLALLVAVLAQVRQASLLQKTLASGRDVAALGLVQVQASGAKLREQWHAAADDRLPLDGPALARRYQQWLADTAWLRQQAPPRRPGDEDSHGQAIAQLDAFITAADRALGPQPQAEPSRSFVLALLPALLALDETLQTTAFDAARRLDAQAAQRAETLRSQSRLALGLTAILAVLALAFAALALRQVRHLQRRRHALQQQAAALQAAARDAQAESVAKSAFLAGMGHEIRTPFHGLLGMLDLLRESGLSPRQIDHVRAATESADRLLGLFNDILDLAQLESGRLRVAPVAVALRPLLRDVEAQMRPRAAAKSLALHIDADPAVPERVLADATRVKQVASALLGSAIERSERGAVVLDVRCQPAGLSAAPGQTLEFVVIDTGPALDAAAQARLFDRWVPSADAGTQRRASSGLALDIARRLARLMGGEVAVRSKPGDGVALSFCMPLKVPQGVYATLGRIADGAASATSAAHAAAPPPAASQRPLRVLVAEDHPVNRQYIAALLQNLGHAAHFTTNGQEALQAARGAGFDLVLMDLHMPVQDGIAATRAIRALPDAALSTVPIVGLTADAIDETRERCLVAGMNDVLIKPVNPQKLQALLRRLFGAAGSMASAAGAPGASNGTAAEHELLPARHQRSQALVDEAAVSMSLQAMAPARLSSIVAEFLDHGPDTVRRLRLAVRDAQPLELRTTAHAAKGAALNLGLTGLAATAAALHEGATHLPAHEIARLVQRFEEQLPLTRQAVAALGLLDAAPPASGPSAEVTR